MSIVLSYKCKTFLRSNDQNYMATKLQVAQSTISSWISGVFLPKAPHLVRIIKLMNKTRYQYKSDWDLSDILTNK